MTVSHILGYVRIGDQLSAKSDKTYWWDKWKKEIGTRRLVSDIY